MKTAVSVLQEMMVQLGQTPEYDHIWQSGPAHASTFECQCKARGLIVRATGSSKKDAKQAAAKEMLLTMSLRGEPVPPPYGTAFREPASTEGGCSSRERSYITTEPLSYVSMLKELCQECRLSAPEYELISCTGPSHMPLFTMRVQVGKHQRQAVSTTKKVAKQEAAEQLYEYIRKNLGGIMRETVSKQRENLSRTHQIAKERYLKLGEETNFQEILSKAVADRLAAVTIAPKVSPVKIEIANFTNAEEELKAAAAARGLKVRFSWLPADCGNMVLIQLLPSVHTFAGSDRDEAAASALKFLKLNLNLHKIF